MEQEQSDLDKKFSSDNYFKLDKKYSLTITFDNEMQLPILMDSVSNMIKQLEEAGSKIALEALKSVKKQIHETKNYKELEV